MPHFSTAWKLCFHSVERFGPFFPRRGIPPTRDKLFLCTIFPRCGKSYKTQAAHRVRLSYRIANRLRVQVGGDYKNQTANSRACRATAQCAAGRAACRATAQCAAGRAMRGRLRGRVEAVPPKGGNSRRCKGQTVAGGGDPGCGLNEPGYRTAARLPLISISPPRSVRGGAVL